MDVSESATTNEAAAAVGVAITSASAPTPTRLYQQGPATAAVLAAYGIAEVMEHMELVPVKQMSRGDQFGNPLPISAEE